MFTMPRDAFMTPRGDARSSRRDRDKPGDRSLSASLPRNTREAAMHDSTAFVVGREDPKRNRLWTSPLSALAPGEMRLHVDSFAFTANNVTYAGLGEQLGYWEFFPAADDWGNIPVWGFADVVESRHGGFQQGERVYGLLPMATHVLLRPDRVGEERFVDGSAHRSNLPSAYNLYLQAARDPGYERRHEGLQALLRPVFITSFLIDDFLADERFFGATRVLLSSASSKTAFGVAHLLRHRGGVEVLGMTSAANASFVRTLGCYDRVIGYDELQRLPHAPTVYLDFAGSADLRRNVHGHSART
jgi:hypothetical protein